MVGSDADGRREEPRWGLPGHGDGTTVSGRGEWTGCPCNRGAETGKTWQQGRGADLHGACALVKHGFGFEGARRVMCWDTGRCN